MTNWFTSTKKRTWGTPGFHFIPGAAFNYSSLIPIHTPHCSAIRLCPGSLIFISYSSLDFKKRTVPDCPMLKSNSLLLFLCFLFEKSSPAPLYSVHPAQNQSRLGLSWLHRSMSTAGNRGANGSFQRVKRGWVWNQFFVLEEYMGSDPQYVGKVRKNVIPEISS